MKTQYFVTVVSSNAAHPQLFGPFKNSGKARYFFLGLMLAMQNRGIAMAETREDHYQTADGAIQADVVECLGTKVPDQTS